ncbi:DUF1304 family protein [Paenarthrobacter aurescens]|uniref:Integral membrane protein n=1 Tax=Paenarthrobacter aurescens TaxID=43663 RepID=A0A4Y3N6R8_PAEAU|nr:DUF1304 family protein [Paenarthrobacter aurescens]MDO6144890.1 DUF1304 domain-containing protein [Paenarthrobacter aurescens]MDO6148735.1 DUF1304 domain-containing protein [Paenarthrobacter aurescens]MDO6159981.1 DUF1304 domain-containing protein [Paenarthrobacter aurescens]MDO6163840.1 DUF1304 domain-containing protein [Paenarthrobacter aurescens]GEB17450.1 hypothetical protein AAU01_02050 [Paenarthrobacter aurescens]
MNLLSQVLAGATGLALISVGVLEIFFHGDQRFHRIFLIRPDDVRAVRMWAMNVGAYNITFGIGIAVGLWLVNFSGTPASGTAIVIFCCACHVFLGFWLWVTEKRLLFSAIGQALFPLLVIVFYVVLH